jgi:hypothetical protein
MARTTSKIRLFQQRIAELICADGDRFAVAPSAEATVEGEDPAAHRANVIVDLPGDVVTLIDRALVTAGIGVIVITPSILSVGEPRAKARKLICQVWVQENIIVNREGDDANTAEELAELIDDLVDGKPSGLMRAQAGELGLIRLAEEGIVPGPGKDDLNEFIVTFETEVRK